MFAYTKLMQAMVASGTVTDPYFYLTTLLLNTSSTNGAQNNTFLDSSSNAFSITRNGGNPGMTQGTFSPFSQTGWGNYFPGSSCLSLANNVALQMGSSDFTMETWVYPTSTANQTIFAHEASGALGFQFSLVATTLKLEMDISSNGTSYATTVTTTSAVNLNQWNHVAVVRSGSGSGNITFYINGVKDATTGTFAGTMNAPATTFQVGCRYASGTTQSLSGYISNARITKGGALYNATFTSSTVPLTTTVSSGTVSLLTCQSNRFVDNSTANAGTGFTITVNGTPSVQAFSPFAPTIVYDTRTVGGSGYFDGTGDYLQSSANAAFDITQVDGTVEAWVYRTTSGVVQSICNYRGGATGWEFRITTGNVLFFYFTSGASITGVTTIPVNSWTHIAYSRSGTTGRLFVNGALDNTATMANGTAASAAVLRVGADDAAAALFTGYISNERLVKGQAIYTVAFTPSTAPLTTTSQGATAANVSLLLNFINAGIYDAAAKNDLETVGNAQVSTTQAKWGTTSMYFDGTGDWLLLPDSVNLQIGSGDFTIEGWVYINTAGVAYGLISKGTSTTGWSVNITSGNKLQFSYTSSNLTGATSLSATTWYYFAVVRSGTATGNLKIYLNGTADATSAGAVTDTFNQTNSMYVGADRVGTSALNGYIDELRITKGFARTITTPTAAFPVQ